MKWQLYFASMANQDSYGTIHYGSANGGMFYIKNLKMVDLAVLYRILNSYHHFYEKVKFGEKAIFHKHLEVIKKNV